MKQIAPDWILSNLSGILHRRQDSGGENPATVRDSQQTTEAYSRGRLKAQGEWCGAIAALESLLLELVVKGTGNREPGTGNGYSQDTTTDDRFYQGVLLSGPTAVLRRADLATCFYQGIFRQQATQNQALMSSPHQEAIASSATLPLLPADPLTAEQFCLVLTPWFSLLVVVG